MPSISRGRSRAGRVKRLIVVCLFVAILVFPALTSAQSVPAEDGMPHPIVFMEQRTAAPLTADDSLVPRSSWTPWNAPTLILQPMLGTALGTVGFGVGIMLSLSVRGCSFGGCSSPRTTGTDILEFASLYGFGILGLATGISLAGDIARADGDFGMTLLGSAGGIAIGAGIIAGLPRQADPARGIAAYLVMISAPIVAYNLTAEAEPLPPPPDPNAPDGRPDYLRPDRGGAQSGLQPQWQRNLLPTGAGGDWQELTFNFPIPAALGQR